MLSGIRVKKMKLVVTLNEKENPLVFAKRAREKGADLLEIRDDISPVDMDLKPLSQIIPLLVSRRKQQPLSEAWLAQATMVDQEISLEQQKLFLPPDKQILSHHSSSKMSVIYATEMWKEQCSEGQCIKHVEIFGPDSVPRLRNLRELLKLVSDRVTVLPMGLGAESARAALAGGNHLYYCKLDENTESAPGQELLEVAVARLKG